MTDTQVKVDVELDDISKEEVTTSGSTSAIRQPENLFIDPIEQPTIVGPEKIRYDFNYGCRVALPQLNNGKKWKVRFTDTTTFNTIFEIESEGGTYRSTKTYYVPFKIECWKDEKLVFSHDLSLRDQLVQIQVPVGTLGDAIAWFPYVDLFQKKTSMQIILCNV